VESVFCDLQKAFDCVNHDILLLKLNFYGITGLVKKLLESYLKNKFQRVIIDNKPKQYFSKSEPASDGVPHSSILGRLLSLLYINDLPKSISDTSNPVPFADDTGMTITHSDPHRVFKYSK
jgi:hypothetical protein